MTSGNPKGARPSNRVTPALRQLIIALAGAAVVSVGVAGYGSLASGGPPRWLLLAWLAFVLAMLAVAARRGRVLGDLVVRMKRERDVARKAVRSMPELRRENQILDNVFTSAPAAMVLCRLDGHVEKANPHASELLNGGEPLEGELFQRVLDRHPSDLREAIGRPRFVVIDEDAEPQSYHLSSRDLRAEKNSYTLHMLRQVTAEVNRQEVDVWKKVIRVFSHELNNSLAPMGSLIHSARLLLTKPGGTDKLDIIFDTIEERTTHLTSFLANYAEFAKLPRPTKRAVGWQPYFEKLGHLARFRIAGDLPDGRGYFDPIQLDQVLLNLIKNAHESGTAAEDVTVAVETTERGHAIRVMDRGKGMTEESIKQAHLPFYSTKRGGTGLGLALCRDILFGHGGQLQLRNREGGGVVVTCWLPGATHPDADVSA